MHKGHVFFSWVLAGALCGLASAAEEPVQAPEQRDWGKLLLGAAAGNQVDLDVAKLVCPKSLGLWAQELDQSGMPIEAEAVRGVARTLEAAPVTTSDATTVKPAPMPVLPPLVMARGPCAEVAITVAENLHFTGHRAECDQVAKASVVLIQAAERELTKGDVDMDRVLRNLLLRRYRLVEDLAKVMQRICSTNDPQAFEQAAELRRQMADVEQQAVAHAQGAPEL